MSLSKLPSIQPKRFDREELGAVAIALTNSAVKGPTYLRVDGKIAFVVLAVEVRSEEHTSELQSLMRISYAVFCLKKKNIQRVTRNSHYKIHTYTYYNTVQKTQPKHK